MSEDDFLNNPFQARTRCCGSVIYARTADMPADYKALPNHQEEIPHLDGRLVKYDFFKPADETLGRKHWFSSAGEVWKCRLKIIMTVILPDLRRAVYLGDNPQAARQLAALLSRIADVYPGLPLYDATVGHGFALGKDNSSYLTKAEYLALERLKVIGLPFFYRQWVNYNFDKLNYGLTGWQDGVMEQLGDLAEACDLIRDNPASLAWSREVLGTEGALNEKIRTRLLGEALLIAKAVPDTHGNTIVSWILGAVRLGIAAKDEYLVREALGKFEPFIINGYFSDGLSIEGAFNYGGMMNAMLYETWMLEEFGEIKVAERLPFIEYIKATGNVPVITLLGIESQHSDEHASFMTSIFELGNRLLGAVVYTNNEQSQNFPEYGLTCLRSGAPGSRLETILDYQSQWAHTHEGKLNLQVFYEGINLLPDLGYGCTVIDTTKGQGIELAQKMNLIPFSESPNPADAWGSWFYGFNSRANTHVTALVDGSGGKGGFSTFVRYFSSDKATERGALNFVEVEGSGRFEDYPLRNDAYKDLPMPPQGVREYRRQIATVTLPDGCALLLDFFRVRGGSTHELLWHFPAKEPVTSLGAGQKIADTDLLTYRKRVKDENETVNDSLRYMTDIRSWKQPQGVYSLEWYIDPDTYGPVTPEGTEKYKRWQKVLQPVRVKLFGAVSGSAAGREEIISARGPWPSRNADRIIAAGAHVIALRGAMNYVQAVRSGENLQTAWAHVLDFRTASQAPVIKSVSQLKATTRDGLGLDIELSNGAHLLVASSGTNGVCKTDKVELRGRVGYSLDSGTFALYDGTLLNTDYGTAELEAPPRLRIVEIVGDITGRPSESALIVSSDRQLAIDGRLVGRTLTVQHSISSLHTAGYEIERVSALADGRWRIDLAHKPPFIQNRTSVTSFDTNNERWFFTHAEIIKGNTQGLYRGRIVRFLRSGFSSSLEETPFALVWGSHCRIALAQKPPAGAVQIGDAFIIYSIQPGDEVFISSFLTSSGTRTGTGIKLSLQASGTCSLKFPTAYSKAWTIVNGSRTALAVDTRGGTTVRLGIDKTPGGRSVIELEK